MRWCAAILLCGLVLVSCGTRESAGTSATADCATALLLPTAGPAAPTLPAERTAPPVSPAPSTSPAPTEVATTPAMSYDDLAATAVAVATAQPFPTAAPAVVRRGKPAEVHSARGGLSLSVAVPSDQLLAGEAARTTLTLHNVGAEPLWVAGDGRAMGWLRLQDERGMVPEPWPWAEVLRPGGAYLVSIAPGETFSTTLTLQTPPATLASEHTYDLWAATRFARAVPGSDGPDNIWLQLEAGPLPLTLVPPRPDQQLTAQLTVNRDGYELQARGPDGQPIDGAWGELEASLRVAGQFEAFTSRPLAASEGLWGGAWDAQLQPERAEIVARAWVAAPGFVTAALTETLSAAPLSGEEIARALGSGPPPCRQQFADPTAVGAALGLPVARLTTPPPGAALVTVEADVAPGRATITTRYNLPNRSRLALSQRATSEQGASASWGEARYDPEAQQVKIGAATGYLIQRYGVWMLTWKLGSTGLDLQAPASALSADELVRLAITVEISP